MQNFRISSRVIVLILGFTGALSFNVKAADLTDQSVILSTEEGQAVIKHQCSRGVPRDVSDFWVPTEKQIRKLEESFKKCVKAKDAIELTQFKRQYAGFFRKKETYIYVNAGKKDSSPLNERAMIVCDGGADFFGFEYNIKTETFSDFLFNGMGGQAPQGYESHSFSCSKK